MCCNNETTPDLYGWNPARPRMVADRSNGTHAKNRILLVNHGASGSPWGVFGSDCIAAGGAELNCEQFR